MQSAFNNISAIAKDLKLAVRIQLTDGLLYDWSPGLFTPSQGYWETASSGPYKQTEIAAIDIDAVRREKIGRLVPDKETDLSAELAAKLSSADIGYENCGNYFRIRTQDLEKVKS